MNQSTATAKTRSNPWISCFMALLTGILLLLALPGASRADNLTPAGPATATPGKATKVPGAAKITVNIPYSGDANGNNSALIQWDEDGGDWSPPLGSQALAHSPNPYSYEITGLDNAVTYQIRVTISDPDGGSNLVQTLTGLKPYNLLLHNAVSTGSGKWGGNWGLIDENSRYGEITCSTCHATSTGNIKRVKETITAANSPTHDFPGGANAPVVFLDARDGSSHFGDDSGGRTTSNRICEVCHNLTTYHRYDASANPGGTTHYNGRDCMECHAHKNAFKADCSSCHGDSATGAIWPDSIPANSYANRDGSHSIHVQAIGDAINLAGGGAGSATLADKNASCIYCHPNPGGPNRNGGGHADNTLNSPANVADVFNDGINQPGEGNFRYIDGSADPDGLYNPNIKRCSNIDCHSNGDFTWTWYEDDVAPGRITDLSAATGGEVGTVRLTWTAPHNDGDSGPVAYGYEVRYRVGGAVTDGNWSSSTIAGGAPSAVRTYPGDSLNQTMTVYGLTPGTTYYFAIKAFDETMTNYAEASNSVSATAKVDNLPPLFQGIAAAVPAYADGAVDLEWGEAEDDTGPVTYLVYWCLANQAINYDTPQATTKALKYEVTGLQNGLDYKFAVRARDASPAQNIDGNTRVKEAIPQVPGENEIFGKRYFAVQSTGVSLGGLSTNLTNTCNADTSTWTGPYRSLLRTDGYLCTGTRDRNRISSLTRSGDIVTWVFNTAYAKKTYIHGGTFSIYLRERSDSTGNIVVIDLGYWNPGNGTFVALDSVSQSLNRKSRTTVKFYFPSVDNKIIEIPKDMKLAVKLRKTTTKDLEIGYGGKRGTSILSVYEQEANDLPNAFTVNAVSSPATGTINLGWTPAVDPDGDPVTYDVYGSIDNGVTWPYKIATDLGTTSTTWDTLKDGIGLDAPQNNVRFRVGASDGLLHRIVTTDAWGLGIGTFHDHRYVASSAFTVDNTLDSTPPEAVTDLRAEHRPKSGTVWLYWHAPGDDGHEGKASQYDIRYKAADVDNNGNETGPDDGPIDSEAKWDIATQVVGEPVPVAPGHRQGYEVLGLNPGKKYYFALKTADEVPNWSPLSNSPHAEGGLRCGVCHGTPPDDLATKGTHDEHGFTQTDCAKCHGQEADAFDTRHMDGVTKLAWNNPKKGYTNTAMGPATQTDTRVIYKNQAGTVTIYDDTTGGGGFNDLNPETGDNRDNGTCFGFNATGVTGCHGPGEPVWGSRASVTCAMCHGDMNRSNKDPYGRNWEDTRTDAQYAGNVPFYKSAPGVDLLGNRFSNAVGQHERHLNFSYRLTGDQCKLCHLGADHADGTVDVHMHSSAGEHAVWNPPAGGNPGTCIGTSEMRCHGDNAEPPPWKDRVNNGTIETGGKLIECSECHGHEDHVFWLGATTAVASAGRSSTVSGNQNGDGIRTTLTVSSTANNLQVGDRIMKRDTFFKITAKSGTLLTLHRAVPVGINFVNGEVLRTVHIPHVYDKGQVRHCTWCHVEGHPQGDETAAGTNPPGQETVFIPNNAIVGLDYSSGGIHLRKTINGRGPFNTEAEICWACHDDNGISEWGTNTKPNTGNSPYDYGTLHTNSGSWGSRNPRSNWVGATWDSPLFPYKTGQIVSTHSVNSAATRPGMDAVAEIRCSYCHDVHDMNHAPGDKLSGKPYLRGTWMGNPYQEDGAPGRTAGFKDLTTTNKAHYYYDGSMDDFGMVPRGTPGMGKMGGFWIDQNSDFPTITWTLSSSAGLCTLCHGSDVNNMNKFDVQADGTSEAVKKSWIGTNGHSNAVIGGSGTNKYNVYDPALRGEGALSTNPGMGYQDTLGRKSGETDRLYGLRNNMGNSTQRTTSSPYGWDTDNDMGVYPYAWATPDPKNRYAYNEFDWGVNRDTGAGAAEPMYHRFSCSKCHNPHASRLPRLMITNCLDVSHNKWDDTFAGDPDWTSGNDNVGGVNWSTVGVMSHGSTNDISGLARNKQFAYAKSAQNCHRYVDTNGDGDGDDAGEAPGWNKITPWIEPSKTFYDNN